MQLEEGLNEKTKEEKTKIRNKQNKKEHKS